MAKLTTRSIEALKGEPGKRTEIQDDDVRGLYVRISPNGVKSWMFRCTTADGRRIKIGLGNFPGVGLADARERARKERVAVDGGHDPAAAKRKAKREARHARTTLPQTVSELWPIYCAAKSKRKAQSTRDYQEWLWTKHIEPRVGSCELKDLDRRTLKLALREIAETGETNANNAQALLTGVLNWAVGEDFLRGNPIARLDREHRPQSRDRVLNDAEIKKLWVALSGPIKLAKGCYVSTRMQIALKVALLTGARRGDVVGLHAREIDPVARSWRIPAARFKGRHDHVVPLSNEVVQLLGLAFAAPGETEPKPIGEWQGFAFPAPRNAGAAIGVGSLTQAMKWIVQAIKIERATVHDLRRTAATYLASERIGIAPHVVTAVLGHQQEGAAVTAIYNRHRYDKEKRQALEAWARLLGEIVSKEPRSSNVTNLRSSRS